MIHSIKWRLQAWHGFLLLCLVAGLMTGFYSFERRVRVQALDSELAEVMTPLLPRFAPPQPASGQPRGPAEPRRRPRPPEDEFLPPPEEGGPPPGMELRRSMDPPAADNRLQENQDRELR